MHNIKHFFKIGARNVVLNRHINLFWHDKWLGEMSAKDRLPGLFSICESRMISLARACGEHMSIRFLGLLDLPSVVARQQLANVINST
jgi:hypothetical protein